MTKRLNAEGKDQVLENPVQQGDKLVDRLLQGKKPKERLLIEEILDGQIQEKKEENHREEIALIKVQKERKRVLSSPKNLNLNKNTAKVEDVVVKDKNHKLNVKVIKIVERIADWCLLLNR